MLRISRLADYATVLMAYLARNNALEHTALDIAKATSLAKPTVSKLLKLLTRAKILNSRRGTHGGYQLAKSPQTITVADIVDAIDGGVAITECSVHAGNCSLESVCQVSSQWRLIHRAIYCALQSVTLADMLTESQTLGPIPTTMINKSHFPIRIISDN
jgi:FeS assembly SUF system regulator